MYFCALFYVSINMFISFFILILKLFVEQHHQVIDKKARLAVAKDDGKPMNKRRKIAIEKNNSKKRFLKQIKRNKKNI